MIILCNGTFSKEYAISLSYITSAFLNIFLALILISVILFLIVFIFLCESGQYTPLLAFQHRRSRAAQRLFSISTEATVSVLMLTSSGCASVRSKGIENKGLRFLHITIPPLWEGFIFGRFLFLIIIFIFNILINVFKLNRYVIS